MNPSPNPRPERGLPYTQTTPRLHASVVPAVEPGAMQCREKVFTSMVASTSRLADFPVDRLRVVRERLWRHSSQPNGDPWDGDPEHLDWAAQHLLNDLTQQLLAIDSPAPLSGTPDSPGIAATSLHRLPSSP
jgi:hypothetical protein